MTFWCGSGSADPYLWQLDLDSDPAIFVIDLHNFSYYFCLMIERSGSGRPKTMLIQWIRIWIRNAVLNWTCLTWWWMMQAIVSRLGGYPHQVEHSHHTVAVSLPPLVAALLHHHSQAVSHVEIFKTMKWSIFWDFEANVLKEFKDLTKVIFILN